MNSDVSNAMVNSSMRAAFHFEESLIHSTVFSSVFVKVNAPMVVLWFNHRTARYFRVSLNHPKWISFGFMISERSLLVKNFISF